MGAVKAERPERIVRNETTPAIRRRAQGTPSVEADAMNCVPPGDGACGRVARVATGYGAADNSFTIHWQGRDNPAACVWLTMRVKANAGKEHLSMKHIVLFCAACAVRPADGRRVRAGRPVFSRASGTRVRERRGW